MKKDSNVKYYHRAQAGSILAIIMCQVGAIAIGSVALFVDLKDNLEGYIRIIFSITADVFCILPAFLIFFAIFADERVYLTEKGIVSNGEIVSWNEIEIVTYQDNSKLPFMGYAVRFRTYDFKEINIDTYSSDKDAIFKDILKFSTNEHINKIVKKFLKCNRLH